MTIAFYYLPSSPQNICISMFSTVILLFLFTEISSDASGVNRPSANCSVRLPLNVTDVWLSCDAQCNTTRVWRYKKTSHEGFLHLVNCTGEIQSIEEPTHDILLIFLSGAACGAGALTLIILLLCAVSCCLKKQRGKRSHGERLETNRSSAQETGDYITTTCNLLDETQNETQHEVPVYDHPRTLEEGSGQTLIPPPSLADIARDNDAEELEDSEPFEESHKDLMKSLKQKLPMNGNSQNEERLYMHLIPETRQGNDKSNSTTTKSPTRSGRKEKETCATKPGISVKLRETNKLTSTRKDARPSSAAYENGFLAKLYSNVR